MLTIQTTSASGIIAKAGQCPIPERGLGGRYEMEFSSHIGPNTAGTVGLYSEAINPPITGTDSPHAGTDDHADSNSNASASITA